MAIKPYAQGKILRTRATRPLHFLVTVTKGDERYYMVMCLDEFLGKPYVRYACDELFYFQSSSYRRPFMDLIQAGWDWQERGCGRAERQLKNLVKSRKNVAK